MASVVASAFPMRVSADLLDLRLAAEQVGSFLRDQTLSSFLDDPLLRDATLFQIGRIAAIVERLPDTVRDRYPDVTWSDLARFTIDRTYGINEEGLDEVWQIATCDVPRLLAIDVPPVGGELGGAVARSGQPRLRLSSDDLGAFTRRWKIRELAVFGSALRDDFRPDSDVDVLVTFADDAGWSLLDHVAMQDELKEIVGRPVDLVERRAVERSKNWIRRREILTSAVPIHVSR